jgi:hypothetical protein
MCAARRPIFATPQLYRYISYAQFFVYIKERVILNIITKIKIMCIYFMYYFVFCVCVY